MTSPFAIRGVIEGFYGTPWTHAQRLNMIEFLSRHDMNTFVYSPKDDPLMRSEWRMAYSGDELAKLAELIDACRRNTIDFVFCISPGLTMEYSSGDDRAQLVAKLTSVAHLGVSSFALLLDDIPVTLQHPSDQKTYPDLVTAHINLVCDIFAKLQAKGRFFMCPTQYWGRGDEDYISRLGQSIPKEIELLWTGRAICSATLDRVDAEVFARSTGRPPVYWDNYPVNDVAMTYELHVGPYRGRDAQLHSAATGIIANGMELYESSKIAFATIADYLESPEQYEPEKSWQAAVAEVAGQDAAHYAVFADTVRSSCLASDDALALQAAFESFSFERSYGDADTAADDLSRLADRMTSAAAHLLRGTVENTALIAEAHPWLAAFEVGALAVKTLVQLYREDRLDTDGPRELGPYLVSLREARVRVFGDVLDMALAEITGLGSPHPQNTIITPPTQ